MEAFGRIVLKIRVYPRQGALTFWSTLGSFTRAELSVRGGSECLLVDKVCLPVFDTLCAGSMFLDHPHHFILVPFHAPRLPCSCPHKTEFPNKSWKICLSANMNHQMRINIQGSCCTDLSDCQSLSPHTGTVCRSKVHYKKL